MPAPKRIDRTLGNRGAFEKARLKILKTQKVCGICGKPVDFSFKNPHPLAPTVDHIIPVSKGGHSPISSWLIDVATEKNQTNYFMLL